MSVLFRSKHESIYLPKIIMTMKTNKTKTDTERNFLAFSSSLYFVCAKKK